MLLKPVLRAYRYDLAVNDPVPPHTPRLVTCPGCLGESLYDPSNPYRPFCSARCKNMDLGAWASEGFRVAVDSAPEQPTEHDPRLQ